MEKPLPNPGRKAANPDVRFSPLLKAHLDAVDEGTQILGVAQRPGIRDLVSQLKAHAPHFSCSMVEIDRGESEERHFSQVAAAVGNLTGCGSPALVLLADYALNDILYLHSISSPAKDAGLPVISCFGRPIFFGPLTNVGGLTYEGIFFRTNHIVRELPITGDYLEFGVFDGRTMTLAWQAMKGIPSMRFFGFDSFAGIIGALDDEKGLYADGDYYSNIPTFMHNLKAAGADMGRIRPVQGDFLKIFDNPARLQQKLGIERCLVAHIDCDIYQAAKAALDFLTGVLVQGSVLLFDEFHANAASNTLGERRALAEWLKENPTIKVERWQDYSIFGRAFFIHLEY